MDSGGYGASYGGGIELGYSRKLRFCGLTLDGLKVWRREASGGKLPVKLRNAAGWVVETLLPRFVKGYPIALQFKSAPEGN